MDRVLLTANETDQFLVKVMVRQCRRPEVGDKHEPGPTGFQPGEGTSTCFLGSQVVTGKKAYVVRLLPKLHKLTPRWISCVKINASSIALTLSK